MSQKRTDGILHRVNDGRCPGGDILYDQIAINNLPMEFSLEHIQVAAKIRQHGSLSQAHAYMARCLTSEHDVRMMAAYPTVKGFYIFEPLFVDGQIYVRAVLIMDETSSKARDT